MSDSFGYSGDNAAEARRYELNRDIEHDHLKASNK